MCIFIVKPYFRYDAEKEGPLPCLMWAYPREYKDAKSASQIKDSPYVGEMRWRKEGGEEGGEERWRGGRRRGGGRKEEKEERKKEREEEREDEKRRE